MNFLYCILFNKRVLHRFTMISISSPTNMTPEENTGEYQRMRQDLTVYGLSQTGSHRGVTWSARKDPTNNCWSAFIHVCPDVSWDKQRSLDRVAHGLCITREGRLGFDCCQVYDYPIHPSCRYKDFPYVLRKLEAMIDVFLDE